MIFKVDTATDPTLRLKVVTIIVGLVDVIIGAVGSCGKTNDIYFLVTVLVVFCLSLLHLMCTILDIFKTNCTSRGMVRAPFIIEKYKFASCFWLIGSSKVDFLFHMIGGILILVTSIILVSGTYPGSCGVMEKTSAATIGIFNSLIYLYICYLVLRLLRQKDSSSSLLPMYLFCACSRNPIEFMERDSQQNRKHSATTPVSVIPATRGQLFTSPKVHTPDSRNSETPTPVQA